MELDLGFKDRIKWAISHKNTNQSEIAREVAQRTQGTCSPQAIQQWVSGATTSPRREHLRAAAEFLGVRYEWLAYGRGPMRDVDIAAAAPPATAGPDTTETALLAHEWEAALLAAMPDAARRHWQPKFTHPSGRAGMRVTWSSDQVLAELGLYKYTSNLITNARQLLWRLVVARATVPGTPQRRVVLLLAPLESWCDVPERHIAALRAEAHAVGIEVVPVNTPEAAAAVLLAQDQASAVPEADDLGLDVSPVL